MLAGEFSIARSQLLAGEFSVVYLHLSLDAFQLCGQQLHVAALFGFYIPLFEAALLHKHATLLVFELLLL